MTPNTKPNKSPESLQLHGLTLSKIWPVIRHRRVFIILIATLAMVGTLFGHFTHSPTYRATARVSVKTEAPKSIADYLGAGNTQWGHGNIGERIHNYVQYLKSASFLIKVAQVLKFSESEAPLIYQVPENASIFQSSFWVRSFNNLIGKPNHSELPNDYNSMTTPVENISSFIGSVMTVRTNHSDHLDVAITTLDPYTSMTIANTIVKEFTRITNEHDSRGLLEVQSLLKEKVSETKEKLKAAEVELIEFKRQNRIAGNSSQSTLYSGRLNEIEKSIEEINLKLAENNKLISFYQNAQKNKLSKALDNTDDSGGLNLQSQLAILNQRLDSLKQQKSYMLSQGYESDHWRLKKVEQETSTVALELKKLIDKNPSLKDGDINESSSHLQEKINTLKKQNQLVRAKLPSLEKSRKELLAKLSAVPQAEQFQLMLQRKLDLEYSNFSVLQKKMHEVDIQLVSLDKKVLIESLSNMPKPSPRQSLPLKLLFSALVGIFAGCLVALLLETIDSSVKHKSDLEDLGIHFLGEIPDINRDKSVPFGVKSPSQLLTLQQPDSLDAVVFDFVRSRLESARTRSGKTSNSITITSVRPNEGKSFITANLAASVSQLGKKTLLVDCDLRCPSVHCYFDLPNDQGLVDIFQAEASLDQVLFKNVSPNLDILTAGWGCKAPTVLISSEKFRVLMKHLRNEYDYVIVDTPPVSAVADPSILSNMTDSVVLVTKYRSTTRHDIVDAQFKIHQMSSKRIHGIINFARDRDDIVKYYPYIVTTSSSTQQQNSLENPSKLEDLKEFEKQLKKKQIG